MALDYKPDNSKVGDLDIVHGAILSEHEGRPNTVRGAIDRRLKLGGAAEVNTRHALVLPSDATDLLNSIGDVIADYERRMIKDQRDLLTITGLRFDPSLPLHRQFELARRFALISFADKRKLATILIQHVPGDLGYDYAPHVHLLAFARQLRGSNWGCFTEIRNFGSRTVLAGEWAEILAAG